MKNQEFVIFLSWTKSQGHRGGGLLKAFEQESWGKGGKPGRGMRKSICLKEKGK